jgi:hypothetical protein
MKKYRKLSIIMTSFSFYIQRLLIPTDQPTLNPGNMDCQSKH